MVIVNWLVFKPIILERTIAFIWLDFVESWSRQEATPSKYSNPGTNSNSVYIEKEVYNFNYDDKINPYYNLIGYLYEYSGWDDGWDEDSFYYSYTYNSDGYLASVEDRNNRIQHFLLGMSMISKSSEVCQHIYNTPPNNSDPHLPCIWRAK